MSIYDMRRIGFRRVLPLAFTAVHLLLVWSVTGHQSRVVTGTQSDSAYRVVVYQETGVPMDAEALESPPLKLGQRAAIFLDFPAVILAVPVALFFHGDDAAIFYSSIVFVPVLWFGIGRWLDGLVGYIPRLRLPRLLRRLLAVAATALMLFGIDISTPLYHHRTTDTYWFGAGVILWSGVCLGVVLSSPVRTTNRRVTA